MCKKNNKKLLLLLLATQKDVWCSKNSKTKNYAKMKRGKYIANGKCNLMENQHDCFFKT